MYENTIRLILIAIIAFSSCGIKSHEIVQVYDPDDLQIEGREAEREIISRDYQEKLRDSYKDKYYRVWESNAYNGTDTKAYLSGLYKRYSRGGRYFAQNKRPWSEKESDRYISSANLGDFPSMNKRAITLHATNARLLPTSKPMFLDEALAGEGYPFDYLQNSAIWASTPLKIVHQSEDLAWYYCISPFVEGWIMAKDIALVDNGFIDSWMSKDIGILLEDEYPLTSGSGFITSGYIGMVLPISNSDPLKHTVMVAKHGEKRYAAIEYAMVGIEKIADENYRPTKNNFLSLIQKLYGSPYGWGGAYFTRDCSALLRDIYSPFGIWLPRNSGSQIAAGEKIFDIEGLSNSGKMRELRDSALPCLSLIYKPGHIVMYLGTHNNQMMIFHSVWGVKTKNLTALGRYIIGGTTITDLEPGKYLPYVEETLLDRFTKFNTLIPEEGLAP
jgi:cell wall-associated NlpC family hydrolase